MVNSLLEKSKKSFVQLPVGNMDAKLKVDRLNDFCIGTR